MKAEGDGGKGKSLEAQRENAIQKIKELPPVFIPPSLPALQLPSFPLRILPFHSLLLDMAQGVGAVDEILLKVRILRDAQRDHEDSGENEEKKEEGKGRNVPFSQSFFGVEKVLPEELVPCGCILHAHKVSVCRR